MQEYRVSTREMRVVMDFNRNRMDRRPVRRNSFASVRGTIVELLPSRIGGRRVDPCTIFATALQFYYNAGLCKVGQHRAKCTATPHEYYGFDY